MCDPKGYGFLVVLVINRVSISADLNILVINTVLDRNNRTGNALSDAHGTLTGTLREHKGNA